MPRRKRGANKRWTMMSKLIDYQSQNDPQMTHDNSAYFKPF